MTTKHENVGVFPQSLDSNDIPFVFDNSSEGAFWREQLPSFPSTRYQGSKRKVIDLLADVFQDLRFKTALDLYSGSGMVTLLLRYMGKKVFANDYLKFNVGSARIFITAQKSDFNETHFLKNLDYLLNHAPLVKTPLVTNYFDGVFFLKKENLQIDRFCQNINQLDISDVQKDILCYCVAQALLMKRPYNLFHRANLEMRTRQVKRSFGNAKTWQTDILMHSLKIFRELAIFPFPNDNLSSLLAYNSNTIDLTSLPNEVDLIYLDPPYLNNKGAGLKYTDFYHFLDGLYDYDMFSVRDTSVSHMPIVSKDTAWVSRLGAIDEFQRVAKYWNKSILVVSYRSDGVPSKDEIVEILSMNGRKATLYSEISYKYALSHRATTKEQVIISMP